MKNRLHVIALVLFGVCFLFDIVVWGGVRTLPEVGPAIADSAQREAPLGATYIAIGSMVDSALPPLATFGSGYLSDALSEGFERIHADPTVAMDLILNSSWNAAHGWLKLMYWATPILLLVAVILWVRRPKQVRVLRR